MSTSAMLPYGARPLPRTPRNTQNKSFLPDLSQAKHDQYQSLDDVFDRQLLLNPSPKKVQPLIPKTVPGDESEGQFVWKQRKERPRVVIPGVVLSDGPAPLLSPLTPATPVFLRDDSTAALQFIRKTPVGKESPKSLCDSHSGDSPFMRQRRSCSGLIIEENPDWVDKKVVPARKLWLKARQMLKKAGLNPRQVTLVVPSQAVNAEAENAEEYAVPPARKQFRRARSDALAEALRQAPTSLQKEEDASAVFQTALQSGRKDGDDDSTFSTEPKDALGELIDEHLKLKLPEAKKAQDGVSNGRMSRAMSSRTVSKESNQSSDAKLVRRTRMASVGATSLWMRRAKTTSL